MRILGHTLAPRRLFDAGRLALGSDSRISGAHDLLDELRVAANESDLTPKELLRLATSDSARVLRMHDVGGLEVGMCADLIVVPDKGGDPYEQFLTLRRSDLAAVFRDGQLAIADATLGEWFAQSESETIAIDLDTQPKLIDKRFAQPDALSLEGLMADDEQQL
jgi:cytosine/adenosine deaminase-related metal-dependent hydrolase